MNAAAGFFGAGVAFLLSGLLVGAFPGLLSSYQVVKILYSWGFFSPQDSFAGSFPDPISMALGKLLLLLALACFIIATLFYFLRRPK